MEIEQLASLSFSAIRVIREQAAGHGNHNPLSVVQFKILSLISEKGSPTMKEAADMLCITKPSATSAIDRLMKAGQLKRVHDKKDRRVIHLELTEEGKNVLETQRKEIIQKMSKTFEILDEKERIAFADILTKIISSHKR